MPTFIVNFLLFFLPLVVLPLDLSPFEIPKVLVTEICLELFIVWSFVRILVSKGNNLKVHFLNFVKDNFPICAFFVLAVFQLLTEGAIAVALGNEYRMQGIFLYLHLFLFAFFIARTQHKLIFPLGIIGFSVLLLSMFLIDPGINFRLVGTMGEPNALAATIIFLWPILLSLKKNNKLLTALILLFSVSGILLTGSLSALIAFILQIFLLFLSGINKISLKFALILCLTLALVSWTLPFIDQTANWDKRSEIWQNAFRAGVQKPILGNGFGKQEMVLNKTAQERKSNSQYTKIDSSHNIFLEWFVQGGVVGLLILLILIYRAFRFLLKAKNVFEIIALLGLLIVLSFNPASIVALVSLFWLLRHAFYVKNS